MISFASAIPIGVTDFFFLTLGLATVAWGLWYYLDLSFDRIKALIVIATGGLLGAVYKSLPSDAKIWLAGALQSILSSGWTSIAAGVLTISILLLGFVLRRTAIDWRRGKPSIVVDGRYIKLKSGDRTHNVWWFFRRRPALSIGDNARSLENWPFVLERIKLTEGEVYSGTPIYLEIANLLRLSFYQYVENRFLSQAKQEFAADTAKAFVGLNQVYNILRLCFVENDISRTGDLLVERYEAEYPSSAWIALLRAGILYGRQDYASAAAVLKKATVPHGPFWGATYSFFYGVNLLRVATRSMKSGAAITDAGIADAICQFNRAERILSDLPESHFKSIALPSAQVLKGISYVYERKLGEAEEIFSVATNALYPGLRARAYNDLGYVKLIKSDVETAERMFTLALAADPSFPLAQTNLGYVYMAQGKYDAAKKVFQGVAEDPLLQQESMRDVLLSKVALAHIKAVGSTIEIAPDAYNDVMKDMRLFDYDGVQPASLRFALIQAELGDKLYQDPKYYGLEIFALTMYARAYLLTIGIAGGGAGAADLKMRALRCFNELRGIVDKNWFVFQPSDGFFRPVYEMGALETAEETGVRVQN